MAEPSLLDKWLPPEVVPYFALEFYGNTVQQWGIALLIFLILSTLLNNIKRLLAKRLKTLAERTITELDDLIVELIAKVHGLLIFSLSLYGASMAVALPPHIQTIISRIPILMLFFQTAVWGNVIIGFLAKQYELKKEQEGEPANINSIRVITFVSRLVIISVLVLLALDNLGVDITALVAGLGVGGVAVALAVQNILGDLFASLSIMLDEPFAIGDFIIVDTYMGTVEEVGLKTTRVRSISGEQLIFSNNDLLQSRIRNYKRMDERRILFSIGITYETPHDKVDRIPGMIQEILETQENVRFDRAHFKEFGDFSLNFEIVYYVQVPDYAVYMDIQQSVNLALFKRFEEEGIDFAYPTQMLYHQATS